MVRISSRGHGDGKSATVAGKLGLSLFLLFFVVVGLSLVAFLAEEFKRALEQRAWKTVPCTVITGEVQERDDDDEPYVFAVSYRYEYAGQTHTGSVYKRNYSGSDKYSDAQGLVQKYPPDSDASCYVDPKNPGEAVLRRDSLLIGLVILLPSLFVVIGAGGIYLIWRRRSPAEAKPIAAIATRNKGLGKFGQAALFGVFAIAGAGMLYPLGIRPIARTVAAESWVETPCKVLRAEVRDHDSDDGTTYSVYVLYQYEFGGRTYKSDRYDFIGGSSSGYKGKARTVDAYRSAERPVCYVNPKDPSQAILKRGFHAKLLLALFPLPFLLIGVGGLVHTVRGKERSSAGVAVIGPMGRMGQMGPMKPAEVGRQVLRPSGSPKMKFIGITVFAAFWNGILSIFVVGAINDLRHGGFSLFQTLFLLPFIAVGLALIAGAVYQFLAMFNPRPAIEMSSGVIPLGGAAETRWSFSGQTSRIGELVVTLRGVEEAKYRQGTDTHTDRNTFYEMELYRTSDAVEIASGQVGLVLPQDTMHSFEAENNKILWGIEVHGAIKGWPDVKESFPIRVTPGIV